MNDQGNVNSLRGKLVSLKENVNYRRADGAQQLKCRWVNGNMVELLLPGGKTLITDPFYSAPANSRVPMKISVDDFAACDYIFLNHAHPDHYLNIKELADRFHPLIFVDSMYAAELSRTMQIDLAYIFPVEVGHSYVFPEFRVHTYHGTHNPLTGINFGNYAFTEKLFGVKGTEALDQYGSLFNTNFMLTLPSGFKIGFAAGIDNRNQAEAWRGNMPNLLLHQRKVYTTAADYADEIMRLGGQLILPTHHEAAFDFNADMEVFAEQVNRILEEKGYAGRMFNPQRMRWYRVQTSICAEEE